MTEDGLVKLTTNELLSRYATAAAAHGAAVNASQPDLTNEAADDVAGIYRELRSRGQDSQRVLLALLDHPDAGVRSWAGAHVLEIAPEEGLRILEELASGEGPIAFSAEMTIETWRAGELRFR